MRLLSFGKLAADEQAEVRKPLGRLDQSELRAVHERIVRRYGLDIHGLVRKELLRLAEAQRSGRPEAGR